MSANAQVANILYEIGEILTIKGDRFRSRAFNMAAQKIIALTENIRKIRERNELEDIPGVGKSIASIIEEILDTGESKKLEELRESLPQGVRQLMELEGIGPKIAVRLNEELGIVSIEDLEKAATTGKIQQMKGFGPKKEANILDSIEEYRARQQRFLLGAVLPVIDEITAYMSESGAINQVEVAGSARRRKETVGDLDVLVSSLRPEEVTDRFVSMPPVTRILSKGSTRSTVVLRNHLQVDLRVIPPDSYGAALQYFTGSKEHNVKLRTLSVKAGYKLNEYGLFKRDTGGLVAAEKEEDIYSVLGMDWMPPELRENRGEIEAAIRGELPNLVTSDQIRGDLHVHTNWSDGTGTIIEMAEKAKKIGLGYIAITDHTKSLGIARGLDEDRLREQIREIDRLNESFENFTILRGTECEIKSDGTLDLGDSVLKDLDFVVASVHTGFKMDEDRMTERIITAIYNEHVSTIGHPTGRIIQRRSPYPLNLEKVFRAAAEQKVMMEINAFPDRLDLNDVNCRAAMEHGVRMAIGSDAHAPNQIDFLSVGVSVARRGWLEAKDVVNTLPVKELMGTLERG